MMKLVFFWIVILKFAIGTNQLFGSTVERVFLTFQKISVCQATPISKNQVVVAAHCFSKLANLEDYRLSLGSNEYEIIEKKSSKNDISLLTTNREFHSYPTIGQIDPAKRISGAFPSNNFKKVSGKLLRVTGMDSSFAAHNLKSVPGDSGSPVFQNGKIIGIHVGKLNGREKSRIGVVALINSMNIFDADHNSQESEQLLAYSKENPGVIAAAITWCGLNAVVCGEIVKGGAIVTGAAITGILGYLAILKSEELTLIKTQLQQCQANQNQISNTLQKESASQRSMGTAQGSFEDNASLKLDNKLPDGVPIVIDGLPLPEVNMRCRLSHNKMQCFYTPEDGLDSVAQEFLVLARLAYLHRFYTRYSRFPKPNETPKNLLARNLDLVVMDAHEDPLPCKGEGCVPN